MNSYMLSLKKLFLQYDPSFEECGLIENWMNRSNDNTEIINPDETEIPELKGFIEGLNKITSRKLKREERTMNRAEKRIYELMEISSDPVRLAEYNAIPEDKWRRTVRGLL